MRETIFGAFLEELVEDEREWILLEFALKESNTDTELFDLLQKLDSVDDKGKLG